MHRNRIVVAALLAILAAVLAAGIAWAKSPCKKGYDVWYHITGNNEVKCQCFQHDKPPKNPEWKKGCPSGDNDSDGEGDGDSDPGGGGGVSPVALGGGNDTDVAAITRLGNYDPTTGTIRIYTVGGVGSFRLIKKGSRGVTWLEVPDDWVAINLSEHRATLEVGRLTPGEYLLFAHHWVSGRSGDDGERFIVP